MDARARRGSPAARGLVLMAFGLAAGVTSNAASAAAAEVPVTAPADLRVLTLEEGPGTGRSARVRLRDGRELTIREGETIAGLEVREVRFDEAVVVVRQPLSDPRLLNPFEDHELRQAGVVPGEWLAGEAASGCPVAVVRVESESAVCREPGGTPARLRRFAAGAEVCAGWRVASLDREAGSRGVVVLVEEATGRRVALAGLIP